MAAEKKAATPTLYIVFKQGPHVEAEGSGGWFEGVSLEASSATAAIRSVVSKLSDKEQAGVFVAVPARSWKPTRVAPKTTVQLELTEVKA